MHIKKRTIWHKFPSDLKITWSHQAKKKNTRHGVKLRYNDLLSRHAVYSFLCDAGPRTDAIKIENVDRCDGLRDTWQIVLKIPKKRKVREISHSSFSVSCTSNNVAILSISRSPKCRPNTEHLRRHTSTNFYQKFKWIAYPPH